MDIAVVGPDGSGKTVLCTTTCEYLRKHGISAAYIHVPEYGNLPRGLTTIGKVLARSWHWADERHHRFLVVLTLAVAVFLFSAARWNVRRSSVILIEHHPCCELPVFGRLYAGMFGAFIAAFVAHLWRKPDVVWVLSIAPEVAYERIIHRGKPLQMHETPEKLAQLSALLRECIQDMPQQTAPQAECSREAFWDAAFAHLMEEDGPCSRGLRQKSPS